MPPIRIYTRRFCAYCTSAKSLLTENDFPFEDISLDQHPELTAEVMRMSGQRTVPQIFVGETAIGGFRELYSKLTSGEFADIIAAEGDERR